MQAVIVVAGMGAQDEAGGGQCGSGLVHVDLYTTSRACTYTRVRKSASID
jgi:hypothetical protein